MPRHASNSTPQLLADDVLPSDTDAPMQALTQGESERTPRNRHERRVVAAGHELDDVLAGVGPIAEFLFGEDTPQHRKRVYRLTSGVPPNKRIPTYRLGNLIRARRSRLIKWIAGQEDRDTR